MRNILSELLLCFWRGERNIVVYLNRVAALWRTIVVLGDFSGKGDYFVTPHAIVPLSSGVLLLINTLTGIKFVDNRN